MDEQSETDRILRQGGTDDAIGRLNSLIESGTQPRDQLYYRLGNAYRKKGNFREAINCYLEAMAVNPDSPATEAHRMLMDIIEYYHKDYYNP